MELAEADLTLELDEEEEEEEEEEESLESTSEGSSLGEKSSSSGSGSSGSGGAIWKEDMMSPTRKPRKKRKPEVDEAFMEAAQKELEKAKEFFDEIDNESMDDLFEFE